MATSPSSPSGAGFLMGVWLFDANYNRIVEVGLPNPLPAIVQYQGQLYTWSYIHFGYIITTAFVASNWLGGVEASVVANPQF